MSQEIEQANSSKDSADSQPQKSQPEFVEVYRPKRWVPVLFVASLLTVGAGGVLFILWASKLFTDPTAALTFIMGSIISLFLLLSTVATTCIYWGQRNIMLQQWKAMNENIAKTDVIISKMGQHQAVMEWQAEIAEIQTRISETVERGYMGIGDMTLTNLVVGGRPTVTIKWVNGGRTPVRNFRAMPVIVFGKEPVSNKIYFIDDDVSPIRASFFPVGAEREIRYEVPDKIEAEDWAKYERGQVQLFIIGSFIYRDINGTERKEPISAMYDRFEEHVYETYEYADAEQSKKLVKPT